MIVLSVQAKDGRNSAAYALGNYDKSFSDWGDFIVFIGFLLSACVVCTTGMISSMAKEGDQPAIKIPRAMGLPIPVEAVAVLFFTLSIYPFASLCPRWTASSTPPLRTGSPQHISQDHGIRRSRYRLDCLSDRPLLYAHCLSPDCCQYELCQCHVCRARCLFSLLVLFTCPQRYA